MMFKIPDPDAPAMRLPGAVSASAFAVDEFFDMLDDIYLERDDMTPSVLRVADEVASQLKQTIVSFTETKDKIAA
jgi:hypothetical protein